MSDLVLSELAGIVCILVISALLLPESLKLPERLSVIICFGVMWFLLVNLIADK